MTQNYPTSSFPFVWADRRVLNIMPMRNSFKIVCFCSVYSHILMFLPNKSWSRRLGFLLNLSRFQFISSQLSWRIIYYLWNNDIHTIDLFSYFSCSFQLRNSLKPTHFEKYNFIHDFFTTPNFMQNQYKNQRI